MTNYKPHSQTANLVSTPVTHSTLDEQIDNILKLGLDMIKKFVARWLPDLTPLGIASTELCWYTDSVENNFVIDYVDGTSKSLSVCTSGSGHGCKFMYVNSTRSGCQTHFLIIPNVLPYLIRPLLGREVVAPLEGRETDCNKLWKWRSEGYVFPTLSSPRFPSYCRRSETPFVSKLLIQTPSREVQLQGRTTTSTFAKRTRRGSFGTKVPGKSSTLVVFHPLALSVFSILT